MRPRGFGRAVTSTSRKGAIHRMANPGEIPMTLIEVQVGDYLGEDDIVRFEDDYGREDAGK